MWEQIEENLSKKKMVALGIAALVGIVLVGTVFGWNLPVNLDDLYTIAFIVVALKVGTLLREDDGEAEE